MRQNPGFTLVEVLVAVALTGIILLTGYSTFQKIMQAQSRLGAAIDVQKNLFYTNEKLAALIRDGGTIDYEEYFNRRMLGYDRTTTNGIYTFTNFSHFGNGDTTSGRPPIYYCGMVDTGPDPDVSTWADKESCMNTSTNVLIESSPLGTAATYHFPTTASHQPYGQYAALAYNYLDPVGYPMPIKLPPIFETGGDPVQIFDRNDGILVSEDPLNVGLPELYLIKKNLDNSYIRTYFRHVYVQDPFPGTPSCTPTASLSGCLGKIQMTKLEDCDEVLADGNPGSDGIIDAWIPHVDFRIGTVACPTNLTIDDIYKSAHEDVVGGEAANLAWIDVTAPEMNVIRATFLPNPLKIPALMSGAGDPAKSPSVSVYLEVQLSTKLRNKSFVRTTMNYPRTLITTYDLSE